MHKNNFERVNKKKEINKKKTWLKIFFFARIKKC